MVQNTHILAAAPWLSLWESWLGAAETERCGTALLIVGTTGAEVYMPSLTVGNGLCAVPGRCNYNPCGQNGTTHRFCHSERSETESRNLPEWQVLSCGGNFLLRGGFLHSACATVGMTQWGDVCTNSPTVSRMFYATPPLISQGCALPASPEGKLLYRDLRCRVLSETVLSFHVRNGT